MFVTAPVLSGAIAFVSFAIIPWGPEVSIFHHYTPLQLTDLPVAVLLILAMSSIGVYGIVLAGWASGSPYSLLGALRSAAQVISYEIAMGLAFVAVFLVRRVAVHHRDRQRPGSTSGTRGCWRLVRDLPVHHGRRDQPAAVRPARGRGRAGGRLPHRVLVDEVRDVLPRRVHQHDRRSPRWPTTLFLGGWRAPWPLSLWSGANSGWWPLLWFLIKVFLLLFCYIWLRGTLPRVRYDQLMAIGWKFLIPVSIVWILLIATVRAWRLDTHNAAPYVGLRLRHRAHRGPA